MTIELVVYGKAEPERRKTFVLGGKNKPARPKAIRVGPVKEYIARLRHEAQETRRKGAPLLEGPLSIQVTVSIARPASVSLRKRPWPCVKPDVDNLAKPLFDSLKGVLYHDDAQVCDFHLIKVYGEPCLRLTLSTLEESTCS